MTDPDPHSLNDLHADLADLAVWDAALSGKLGPDTQRAAANLERRIDAGEVDPDARLRSVQYARMMRPDLIALADAEASR